MMVKELIGLLKQYNPYAEITTPYSETIELSYISDNGATKENTELVFIECADEVYGECAREYIHELEDVVWCAFYDKPCTNKKECDYFEEFTE